MSATAEMKGGNLVSLTDDTTGDVIEFTVNDTSSTELELATKVLAHITEAQLPIPDDNRQEVLDAAKEGAAQTSQAAIDKASEIAAAAAAGLKPEDGTM